MMPAAKHGDPQLGVDIHLCVVPPSPSPVPLPTPHMSIVFDPFDYVPYLGATVTVCGMKRATAGTNAMVVHIPPGFPFAPKLPDKDDELFMGSATVVADGDPFSFIGVPVLGCQVAGMISPPRLKKKGKKLMLLPTTFNLAIPTTVFVGGPPTISLMGMASKLGFAAFGKFLKSKFFKRIRQKLFGHMKPGFLKCLILRAEPVNLLTGEVSIEQEDFTLPGRIPIQWTRSYASGNRRRGLCGHGWESPADGRIEIDADGVSMHYPGVGPLHFAQLPIAQGEAGAELELMDGALLTDHGTEFRVRTKEDRIYHFPKELVSANAEGRPELALGRISDLCGNWLEFERRQGCLIGINESAGRRIDIVLENNLIREVALYLPETERRHTFIRLEHDVEGDLVVVRDALDSAYTFAYDAHHMVRHTDRNGLSFYYDFDRPVEVDWRVAHAWGDGGLYDYRFEYLDALNERRITDSLGHVSIVKLDESGLPISEIDPLGGMTVYEYDDVGRTTAVVDPAGRRTEYAYDERGNLLKLVRPDGAVIATVFDEADKPVTVTDPNGAAWQQRFDARGLLLQQVSPLGYVSRYEYGHHGQLLAFVNPRGARTELRYDAEGQLAQINDALGHATLFAHDVLGNLVAKGDALDRRTQFRYDAKGRLIAVKLPSGSVVQCGYDAEDNLTEYIDENRAITRLEYFGQGEIARRIQPDGHQVEYLYDTEERLIGVRNQRGDVYQLKRDELGRIVEEIDYWGQARGYSYDGSGYLVASQDPLRRRIAYDCDPLGRVVKKTFAHSFGGEKPWEESFAYDANDNLVATANAHVAVTREFDAEGRLLKEVQAHTEGQCFTIENAYDETGNRTRRRTDRSTGPGHVTEYDYDLLDQAIGVRIDGGPPMRMQRDAVGQILTEELAPGLTRRYGYNANGLVTEHAVAKDGKALFNTRYEYDAAGNLIRRDDSQFGVDRYVYDPMGRILEHTDPHQQLNRFFNDPVGDRLVTQVIGSAEQPTQASGVGDTWRREGEYLGVRYRFDRAGNLTRKADADSRLDLAWDTNQRLIASRRTTREGAKVTTYGYDPLGRRLFKETEGDRTWFGWDGAAMVCDVIGDRGREWVYRAGTFEPMALISHGLSVTWLACEPNGRPSRGMDAGGRLVWRGNGASSESPVTEPVRSVDVPLRYQGQYADRETGLYYNLYRYFDPGINQFLSVDPLGQSAGPNVYGYAPNPFGWIDPWGLKKCNINPATKKALQAAKPSSMVNPHMHHIVMEGAFSHWKKENRELVEKARDILSHHGIDLQGGANVKWAQNSGHSIDYAKKVLKELESASPLGKQAVVDKLDEIGTLLGKGLF
ncbi:RHS repeat-associated core domain-containing protein [Variovorax sp. CF079]|uniref:RHS repeat-associated core domain-containing protein n=1 Tax=Variovorax sp. CF079 TaxID=1882774 RepID=UPI0008887B86|nr:RHS repeat-associated core domain-containing protein [Variovorax sp. CF079]SDE51130.1 RHS repeat-associated core domain-containing protein [Variovorax sp. CF079]